jgi:hypothetical protein
MKLNIDNIITESLLFILLSFLIGHVIQALAKSTVEKRINKINWNDSKPGEIYLIKGNPLCPEVKRKRIIELLHKKFRFSTKEIEFYEKLKQEANVLLEKSQREAKELSPQDAKEFLENSQKEVKKLLEKPQKEAQELSYFYSLLFFTFIMDKGIGEIARIQMIFYHFFRGLVLSSLFSFVVFSILFIYRLNEILPINLSNFKGLEIIQILYPLTMAILFLLFIKLFEVRAKQRAEYYIDEVYNSVIGYFVPDNEEKNEIQINSPKKTSTK